MVARTLSMVQFTSRNQVTSLPKTSYHPQRGLIGMCMYVSVECGAILSVSCSLHARGCLVTGARRWLLHSICLLVCLFVCLGVLAFACVIAYMIPSLCGHPLREQSRTDFLKGVGATILIWWLPQVDWVDVLAFLASVCSSPMCSKTIQFWVLIVPRVLHSFGDACMSAQGLVGLSVCVCVCVCVCVSASGC